METRGVLEPVVAWWFAEFNSCGSVTAARLTCRMVRELIDNLMGGFVWRHLRITSTNACLPTAPTMLYGSRLAGRLARVPGWAAACLQTQAGEARAALAQPAADTVLCGALDVLRRGVPHSRAVALLDQLLRVCGRAPSWSRCTAVVAWGANVPILDWLWHNTVEDPKDVTEVREYATSVDVLRWTADRAPGRATPRAQMRMGYDVMRCAFKRGDVELARAYVETTRCLGRHVAWVFDYALALEEHGGVSTLEILRMLADRFRIKHIRDKARGRIMHADRKLNRRSDTVAWLVERFGLDGLVAPTRWRDEWEWMGWCESYK